MTFKNSAKYIITTLVFHFVLFYGIFFDTFAPAMDNRVYAAYTESITTDFDLNIANNVSKDLSWLVSKTYNNPDMHDHGLTTLWSPFFIYTKFLSHFNVGPVRDVVTNNIIQAIITLFFSLLGIIFSKKLLDTFKTKSNPYVPISIFALTTSFAWYSTIHHQNSDLTVFFFASLFLWACKYLFDVKENKYNFFLGLLWGVGLSIKISMLFYFPCIVYFFCESYGYIPKKKWLTPVLSFLLGLAATFSLFYTNIVLKFGFFVFGGGYKETLQLDYSLFWEALIGPNGYFHLAPITLLCFLVWGYVLLKTIRKPLEATKLERFIFLAMTGPILKMFLECFGFFESSEFGVRHYLLDLPLFSAVILYTIEKAKASSITIIKKYYYIPIAMLLLWSFTLYLWFWEVHERVPHQWGAYYINETAFFLKSLSFYFMKIGETFKYSLETLSDFFVYLPLTLILTFSLIHFHQSKITKKFVLILSSFIIFSYTIITALNYSYNESNVAKMKTNGDFTNIVVANGIDLYLYDEILSSIGKGLRYNKVRKKKDKFKLLKSSLVNYLDTIETQIVHDPIGFTQGIKKLQLRKSFHEPWSKPDLFIDYDAKSWLDTN